MVPARASEDRRASNRADHGATAGARSRTNAHATAHAVSHPIVSSTRRARTPVTSPNEPTRAVAAAALRLAQAEQHAAERQAAEEQFVAEHHAAEEGYMDDGEENMDDDDELMDDFMQLHQLHRQFLGLQAPLAQAIANLATAATQPEPLPPIILRGIGMVAMDIRGAQANIDAARIAGNTPLVEVEQSLLAVYQNELAAINERVQWGRQR